MDFNGNDLLAKIKYIFKRSTGVLVKDRMNAIFTW